MLFREDQRFRGQWLMLFVGAGCLFAFTSGIALVVMQVLLKHPLGNKPMPDAVALTIGLLEIGVGVGLLWLLWASVLQVEVTQQGLFVRFRPFHRKVRKIDLDGVVAIQAVQYRPMRDYGGWGLRRGVKSRCYNVSGDIGVRIDYANGYHLMIGTARAEELEAALHSIWTPPAQAGETGGASE